MCRYAVRIIPKCCPDVAGISVRMHPKYVYNAEVLEKKLKRIDEHIVEYLSQMDKNDEAEPDAPSPEQIKAAIEELTLRKEKYQGYLKELLESGETQLLTTDPEACRMHSKDGFHCCYNVQTAWTMVASQQFAQGKLLTF